VLIYGGHVHGVLAEKGFDPATVGLSPDDVSELGALVSAGQTALDEVRAARLELKAKIKNLTAANGTHARLVGKLRRIARSARNSQATSGTLAALGVSRTKTNLTPRTAPAVQPEFTLCGVTPGVIHVRFRTAESARLRARAEHTTGVQIAVVDGSSAPADNEADTAWNVFVSHSPAGLDATKMPRQVRLYARWITRRGHTGPWSLPLAVSVI
jgi:hypothetical protein